MQAPFLPADIVRQIADLCDRHTLAQLSLVSHDWRAVCGLRLFANLRIIFRPRQPDSHAQCTLDLLYALAQTPRLGSYVRSLSIRVLDPGCALRCTFCKAKEYGECIGRQLHPLPCKFLADLYDKAIRAARARGQDWWLNYEVPPADLWTIAARKLFACRRFVSESKALFVATLILALRTCVNLESLELVGDISPHSLDDQCILEAARTATRLRCLTVPVTFLARQTQFKNAKGYLGPGKAFHRLARWSHGGVPTTLVVINNRQVDPFISYAFRWLAVRSVSFVVLNKPQERATQLTILPAYYYSSPAHTTSKTMETVLHQYLQNVREYCIGKLPGQPRTCRFTALCVRIRPDQLLHLSAVVSAVMSLCALVEAVELQIVPDEDAPDQDIPPSVVVHGLVPLQDTLKRVVIRQGEQPKPDPVAARMREEFLLAAKHAGLDMVDEVRFWNRAW